MSRSVCPVFFSAFLFAALLAPSAGCKRADHESEHGHPHGPDDQEHSRAEEPAAEPIEQTLASLGELYLVHLIHPTFVRGLKAEVLLHGTRRDEGGPITKAEVSVVARGPDGATLRFAAREHIPGHWPAEAEFPTAGRWTLIVDVRSDAGAEQIEIGTIEVHPDAASASKAVVAGPPAGVIPFLFEQQWPVAMQFERVVPRPLTEWLTVPGRVDARPGGEAHVAAPVAGRVIAGEKGALARPGDRVAAGDVLGFVEPHLGTSDVVALQALEYQQHQLRHELDLQQLEAERALGTARVRIQAGTRELERAERLVAATLATQQELDRARADLDLARAEENAAIASLKSVNLLRDEHAEDPATKAPRLPLVAPISGVLAEVDVVLGESVEAGALLAVVIDLETVWAVAEVPESQLAKLGTVTGARLRGTGVETVREIHAAPVRVAPRVRSKTRALDVAFEVGNPDGELRVDRLLSFDLELQEHSDALSVPTSALVYEQGQPLVYALVDGESVVKRYVRLGIRDRDRVQVLEGLTAGDSIVATRPGEVRLAALSGSGGIVEHQH